MGSDGTFKIRIGDGWRSAAAVSSGHPRVEGVGRIDPAGIRDVVDIVVGGTSLASRTDEDSVFFLMRDLLAAVERLAAGDGSARVSFYESPHELVFQRLGDAVFITFYRGGHIPEVVVKDQRVGFAELRDGVLASAGELERQALSIAPELKDDPLIHWMRSAVERLNDLPADRPEQGGVDETHREEVRSTRWEQPRDEQGFSFGFRFEAGSTDLLSPGRPLGNDLNTLLFRGQFAVHARGRRRQLGEGFLFLQAEKMLASVRQLLAAWEEGRPMSVRLISEGLVVGVRLGADDSLVVSLFDRNDEESILVVNDVTPWEYADAVLGAAREVRRLIVQLSPKQRKNLRLESFAREVRSLASWAKEQRRGAVVNRDTERYRRMAERRPVVQSSAEIGEASRLTFRERWRIEAEGLDLAGTRLCGELALVSARGFILGVESESGSVLWRRETDRAEAVLQMAGRDGIVRVAPSGQVDMLDLMSGVLRWRAELAARSGGSPVLLVVDHGPVPGLVVVAEEERKLVALDLRTGEPRWRFTVPRGGRFSLRRHGRLLYVASSDNQLSAVDMEDGSLVWRYPDRTRFYLPAAVEDETLIVPGGRPGKPDGKMYALDAFSGELKWETALDGGALTAAIAAEGAVMVPVRSGRKYDLVALDLPSGEQLWRLPCRGWAETCALMALDDAFIINAAGGTLRSLRARDGQTRWTTVLGPACSDDVPLNLRVSLRGGVLFVPADTIYLVRPGDGHVVHTLGGEPPVPDMMQVGADCSVLIAEESGHIAMYELARRLSVVDGGA
jgi:outer membrane protein assembly factor BamB